MKESTVMDSLRPVEPRGDAANRQRARAEARASFACVGARTEPCATVRDRRLALAFSSLVEPLRGGDRQYRGRGRWRRFLCRDPDGERGRRGRGDHPLGGADLSQRRPGGQDNDPARSQPARAALLAASGDADVRGRTSRAAARGRHFGRRCIHCGGNIGVRPPRYGRKPDRRKLEGLVACPP